jgi:hypothetical protein
LDDEGGSPRASVGDDVAAAAAVAVVVVGEEGEGEEDLKIK